MKILYILLKSFKRFPLRDIEIFEHTFNPKSNLIMILGPNGSGKSSLLRELSPLPSNSSDFNKGGYKEIHIEKDNKIYKLISNFVNEIKYSFIVDNEELNLSNNITTQRELVFKHFNISQITHELLVGDETFTEYTLLKRKKLFNTITNINIDSILDGYNQLKEELKNNELILKTNISLLQSEEEKLANKEYLNELLSSKQETKDFIDFLLNFRTELYKYKTDTKIDIVYQNLVELQNKLLNTISKYYLLISRYPSTDLSHYKVKYNSKLNLLTYQLNLHYTELETKQQELKVLEVSNQTDINTLKAKLLEYTSYISNITNNLCFYENINVDVNSIKTNLSKLEISLLDIINSIPVNIDKKYSREKYDNLLTFKKELLDKLTNISSNEISLNKQITDLSNNNNEVTCPKCNHIWSLNNNKVTISKLKNELTEILKTKYQIQNTLKEVDKEIEELVNYFNLYKQYSSIRNSTYSILKSFWETIDTKELIFKDPKLINSYINKLNNEVINIELAQKYTKEITEINNYLTTISNLKNTNIQQLTNYIEELNTLILEKQIEKDLIVNTLQTLDKISTIYTHLNTLKIAIEASRNDLFTTNISYTISDILNLIESDLTKYKVTLLEIEKKLHQYTSIQYTIDKYKKQIEDVKLNIKVLNIILNELSPKNGLIAKYISSFLNTIISNINSTIANIWEYKMILKPIDIETEILNYKFIVEVEDKLSIADISKVSSGMKEIINLSFKLILYKLLNLDRYPIWLDEFGVKLDKVHRSKIFNLIFKILNSDKYSQVFLVTHLDTGYSTLDNVDIIDLS